MKLWEQWGFPDWGDSDGIGECEQIIKDCGGKIEGNGLIDLSEILREDADKSPNLIKAVNYLQDEWDYFIINGLSYDTKN